MSYGDSACRESSKTPMLLAICDFLDDMAVQSRGLDPDEVSWLGARLRTALYFEARVTLYRCAPTPDSRSTESEAER